MTQLKNTYSKLGLSKKDLKRKTIFLLTISLFSSLKSQGFIIQHQSPSSQIDFLNCLYSSLHVVVFPTPIVPFIITSFFICLLPLKIYTIIFLTSLVVIKCPLNTSKYKSFCDSFLFTLYDYHIMNTLMCKCFCLLSISTY